MIRIAYSEVHTVLQRVLLGLGFAAGRAKLCARLFVDASRDGVDSHGLSRFPRFVRSIQNRLVDVHAEPQPVAGGSGRSLERWDGRRGPGNLNAWRAMERALELARAHGMGCVALGNTNHWMRGGAYGWQAAEAGAIALCWTNTMPNLAPWGSEAATLGNNPLVFAVPRRAGHIVLDMAMSQFSYGALQQYRLRGERLPVQGGFDEQGRLTDDPAAIEKSGRLLPTGYWKGSGMALLLDLMAGMLSGGRFTHQIPADAEKETGLSQMFIALDPAQFASPETLSVMADEVIRSLSPQSGTKAGPVRLRLRYPGQRVLAARQENLAKGIPVRAAVWDEIQAIASGLGQD